MNHYYIAQNGEQQGPFSLEQIAEKIKSKELNDSDYIYDSEINDWVLLQKFAATANFFTEVVYTQVTLQESKNEDDSWFILKAENKYGPFTMVELVKMLQDKSLFEFDYVWKKSMDSWKQIADLNEFSVESIKKLMNSEVDLKSEIFFRRRHVRTKYGISIIIHNNIKVWRGNSFEISAGGAGISMENENLSVGETVYLHFQPGDGVPPFNAVCEIVSKKANRQLQDVTHSEKEPKASHRYGVKFNKINYSIQKAIKDFASKKAA